MKKLLAISLILAAPVVSADSISAEMECPKGGVRILTGDYAPVTGKLTAETILDNCINQRGTVSNGKVTVNGTFKFTNDSQLQIDAEIDSDIARKNNEKATQQQCEKTVIGTYDMESSYLDGSVSSNCQKQGAVYAPIFELVAGLDERESLEGLEEITLDNFEKLDKGEVTTLIESVLAGNEISTNKSTEALFALAMTNGLTSAQKQSVETSGIAACSDLNYPGMWEYLGLCK
ncbi:MAG: hypothetical protein methR_P0031 [Methyloprofundus sp.]|nr:MAG: hypothetical protein methR_P0031 [Methyloprofundus sp.]